MVSGSRVPSLVTARAGAGAGARTASTAGSSLRDAAGSFPLVGGTVPSETVHDATIDAWLPDPAVCTHHRRRSRATPDRLWAPGHALRRGGTPTPAPRARA